MNKPVKSRNPASPNASHSAAPKRKTAAGSKAKQPRRATAKSNAKPTAAQKAKPKAKANTKPTTASRRPRTVPPALKVVETALADMKAVDIRVLDVRGVSDVADYMVIASGTSDRHLRSIADRVIQMAKAAGHRPLGVEGEQQGEWVLVDLPDVMVHVMLPRTREFYQLEHLWDASRAGRA
jgi:ribosome silencing factor RsfS/YbeB/iojap